MKDIYVIDVIEKCGGRLVCGDNNAICDNFKIDTREIKENDTFVGIKAKILMEMLCMKKHLKMELVLVSCRE